MQIPHYYSFLCEPGQAVVSLEYSSNGFPGVGGSIGVSLYKDSQSPKNRIVVPGSQALYSQGATKPGQNGFSFRCEAKVKLTLRVEPPNGQLLVAVGRYNIRATGAVSFEEGAESEYAAAPGTYRYGNEFVKLTADGSLESTTGYAGAWKMFDAGSRTYVLGLGDGRQTLTYWPGVGFAQESTRVLVLKRTR